MEKNEYLTLSQLFDSIGIIEKGIDRLYHYLLKNKNIENLKDVCQQYGLTLKRGYKIASVLNELELVQIYDRPMKINLSTPVVPIWQKIINSRIEELAFEFQEKKERCKTSLDDFFGIYNLKDEDAGQEPVEFISYTTENIEDLYYPFTAKTESKIALGIRYENPLISLLQKSNTSEISKEIKDSILAGLDQIKDHLKELDIQVIFNQELIEELIQSKQFEILQLILEEVEFRFKKLELRVTNENFSNFSITDHELIQPSFDPTNKLIGSYVSRNKSIHQIFYDKFNELFDRGVFINEFIKSSKQVRMKPLNEIQMFTLCLL